jgi:hypothetical protein
MCFFSSSPRAFALRKGLKVAQEATMRGRLRLVMAVGPRRLAGWHPSPHSERVRSTQAIALSDPVDSVVAGKPAGGDAFLANSHFMWAADGSRAFRSLDDVAGALNDRSLCVSCPAVPRPRARRFAPA